MSVYNVILPLQSNLAVGSLAVASTFGQTWRDPPSLYAMHEGEYCCSLGKCGADASGQVGAHG